MELSELSQSGQRILSYVKANVVLNLLEAVAAYDEEAKKLLRGQKYTLQISVRGGPKVHVAVRDGKLTYKNYRMFWPTLALRFPRPVELNKMFSGKKAFVLPVIGGVRFLAALKNFKALMARLQYYMSGAQEIKDNHQEFLAKMLLYATAFGLSEVAMHDPYVLPNVEHMSDGVIEVYVTGKETLSAHLIKQGRDFFTHKGRPQERSNSRLIFRNVKTLLAVLTGKTDATLAMAMTDIVSEGNRAIMKEVFPVLDRLNYYMAIK